MRSHTAVPVGSGFTVKPTSVQSGGSALSVIVCAAVDSWRSATSECDPSCASPTAHAPVFGPPGTMSPANTCAGCVGVSVTFWMRTMRVLPPWSLRTHTR